MGTTNINTTNVMKNTLDKLNIGYKELEDGSINLTSRSVYGTQMSCYKLLQEIEQLNYYLADVYGWVEQDQGGGGVMRLEDYLANNSTSDFKGELQVQNQITELEDRKLKLQKIINLCKGEGLALGDNPKELVKVCAQIKELQDSWEERGDKL